jgi:hypothetical protein
VNRSRAGTGGTEAPGVAVLVADDDVADVVADDVVAELPQPEISSAAVAAATRAARIIRGVDCVYKLIEPQRF